MTAGEQRQQTGQDARSDIRRRSEAHAPLQRWLEEVRDGLLVELEQAPGGVRRTCRASRTNRERPRVSSRRLICMLTAEVLR